MVNVLLYMLDGFFFGMSSDVPRFKVGVFASDLNFELEWMNISSRHSNSNFAYHIVIHWSLFKVTIESLHYNSHQREVSTKNWYF